VSGAFLHRHVSPRSVATACALVVMCSLYASCIGAMALRRHWNLESQALDMGYADQVTWNMTQGRLFRFTLFRGPIGAELGQPLPFGPEADRDSLLAFHTEFLFLPLALAYALRPGPETLIVVLTGVLAAGGVPAYLLGHAVLRHRVAALAFAAAYLLAPSIQAANLSDFHVVSMAPVPLLFGTCFLLARRHLLFTATAITAALMKEEVGLLVAMQGIYVALARGERRFGLATACVALAWVAVCVLIIIPSFSGGASSLFAGRYAEAVQHLRRAPLAWMAGQPEWPVPAFTVTYLTGMLAGTGFLALLSPARLALAAPALAINGLSGAAWQHGGGAHYSAEAIPGILFAAAGAVRWLSDPGESRRWRGPRGLRRLVAACFGWGTVGTRTAALSLVVLGASLHHAWTQGILPRDVATLASPTNGRRATLHLLASRIPRDARLSAQSNLFPHLSNRERIYVFPAIEDAEFILVDVAGTSDPLSPDELAREVDALLADPRFELLGGEDGMLLFRAVHSISVGLGMPDVSSPAAPAAPAAPAVLPATFFRFTQPDAAAIFTPAPARFEDLFEVVGYRVRSLPEVNFAFRRAVPTVYVRALRTATPAYRFNTFRLGADGLARIHVAAPPAQLWRPSHGWVPGEVVQLTYPPAQYLPGERLGIGVQIGQDAVAPRLRATSATLQVVDSDRVPVLGTWP
jgi:uncharacterized membrane protein